MKSVLIRFALGVAGSFLASIAIAQGFPGKPIRVILIFTPGSLSDVLVRLATDKAAAALGQPIIIEHKPGAGGNLAADFVAKAPADGHTLLFGATPLAINASLYRKLPYDAIRDFAPITLVASGPLVMFVNADLPAKNVGDFIAHAKTRPNALNYASVGVGSATHLGVVLFSRASGIELTHVPYKGIAQILPDMVSGQVHLTFNAIGPATQFVQAGKLRMLAVTSPRRLPHYPDLPSVAETLPGFDVSGWYGFFAPAATPREVLVRLNTEFVKTLSAADVPERVGRIGLFPHPQSLEEAALFLPREVEKWGQAVRASGATAD
ncbi:MAG: tripartite tricarboxylate transporter substrate binding protein [Betaproteobacteria bacterium]|nr:tripartite tricarboxylate transporter substrate binding protein [Betaproteobacteria bacterium]